MNQSTDPMISHLNLQDYISEKLPAAISQPDKKACRHVYDVVKQLFTYTAKQVATHNLKAAKQCMALAEQLYQKGNRMVKIAVENVFVYSFSHAFFSHDEIKKEVMPIMPPTLYELYKKQVIYSHL